MTSLRPVATTENSCHVSTPHKTREERGFQSWRADLCCQHQSGHERQLAEYSQHKRIPHGEETVVDSQLAVHARDEQQLSQPQSGSCDCRPEELQPETNPDQQAQI